MGKVFIIAEAGVNHNGDINNAKKLIDLAAEAGADAVKFQTFKAEKIVCRNTVKAEYQRKTTSILESQYDMLKKLELSRKVHINLAEYCYKRGIHFLSSPFDIESIQMLYGIDMPFIKIPSGEITNLPYLREIAKVGKDIIMSTGMSSLDEIRDAKKVLKGNGVGNIIILHCNTQYPTPMEDANLNAMLTIKKELDVPVGYSDHTEGIEVAIAAAALGAVVIEKQFTLDRGMEGPDHKASIEFNDLKKMVNSIRNIEKALGSTKKEVTSSEIANISIVRKSIVASKDIKKGELFSEDNLTTKRPGTGISPMKWDDLIGKPANRNYKMDDLIIN